MRGCTRGDAHEVMHTSHTRGPAQGMHTRDKNGCTRGDANEGNAQKGNTYEGTHT